MDWLLDLTNVRSIMEDRVKDDAVQHVYDLIRDIGSLFTRDDMKSSYVRNIIFDKINRTYSRDLAEIATQGVSPERCLSHAIYTREALVSIVEYLSGQARLRACFNHGNDTIHIEDVLEELRIVPIWQRNPAPT